MGFLNYWPLALLALIPVIIILYLLKQKTEPHKFPSLFLWRETYRNMHSDTPWEKLKKSLLMVMQILTVIALIIALMSPYIRAKNATSDHVILVMDTSASMKTRYEGDETRLDIAIRDAVSFIERMPSDASISIIESNKDATLLLSDSSDKSLAIRKIKALEATNFTGSCEAGASMVHSMTVQWESCQVICYTDTALSGSFSGTTCTVFDVYNYCENKYVEYVGHGRNADGSLTILAKITNDSGEPLTGEANLYGDGKIIAVSAPLNIPAKSSDVVYFENISFSGSSVCVELNNAHDALPEDDRAYDIITDIKACEALLLTNRNLYLEKAIALIDGINVTKSADAASFEVLTAGKKYDLYIFDGMVPDEIPPYGNLIFIDAYDGNICAKDKEVGGIVVRTEESKLTAYLDNYKFGVSGASAVKLPLWADPFLVSRDENETYCIGAYGSENGRAVCMLGFDFHNSDLPLKLEFPILMYNIMSYCAGTGMLQTTVVNAGNSIHINSGQENVTITYPSGRSDALSSLSANFSDTGELGVYSLARVRENKPEKEYFAVNFPKSESTAIRSQSETGHNVISVDATATGTMSLRTIIILIILGLLVAEWIVFLRGM
ncbi:MAG: BatA and WFA domain-containing protein [Lachnospiraceae bacterium]|nr:BatA and WFA domain-containing protein [Lachnospiraceae bacterium]